MRCLRDLEVVESLKTERRGVVRRRVLRRSLGSVENKSKDIILL